MQLRGRAEPVDIGIVAVLSLLSTLPLFLFDPGIAHLVEGSLGPLLQGLVLLLLLLPLPAAYVARISGDGFRIEALGALITLPLAFLGLEFAALSLGLVLGLLLVSYRAEGTATGEKEFWTSFRSTAVLVTVLAVVLGLSTAYAYGASSPFRNAVQGNLTEQAVDTATEFVDLSQEGLTSSRLTTAAALIAENASRTSIARTERQVFQAVNESGSFSAEEQQLLRAAFAKAEQDIPADMKEQARRQVAEQFQGKEDLQKDLIASRTAPIVQEVSQPTLPVLAVVFFTVFSIVYLFRMPVAALASAYGLGLDRLQAGEEDEGGGNARKQGEEQHSTGRRPPERRGERRGEGRRRR